VEDTMLNKAQAWHVRAAWQLGDLIDYATGDVSRKTLKLDIELLRWMRQHHRDLSGVSPPVRVLPAADTPPGLERGG